MLTNFEHETIYTKKHGSSKKCNSGFKFDFPNFLYKMVT